ncbi:hypothetical protein HDU83_005965 [Entophlyctis luteolus]|nr:hypothetical protein HDU82_004117 [Entophlyctis luteolus]KAJ3342774.1 hypothetical protein HDU83_005965 [Entophlyctis luteolus]KAJ3381756.1 hypothetical protein HDU84_004864 [Entophlyctis sp. JEL0112]
MDLISVGAILGDFIIYDGFGGKNRAKPFQARHVVNLFKGAAMPWCLGLMAYYNNYSFTATTFAALHSTYGIVWLVKDALLPDPQWNRYVPIESTIMTAGVLTTYLAADYLCISRRVEVSPLFAMGCVIMHSLGMVLMMGTDTQRYFQLKYKKGLITDGWMSRSRNTNYLGEVMIYSSYFLLGQHWFPWIAPGSLMLWLFVTNMARKDQSLRKKDGAPEYFKKAWFFFPNLKFW